MATVPQYSCLFKLSIRMNGQERERSVIILYQNVFLKEVMNYVDCRTTMQAKNTKLYNLVDYNLPVSQKRKLITN